MEKQLEQVKSYDWGQSRVALSELEEMIRAAHGNTAEVAKFEDGLLGVLNSDAKQAGKQFACRQLSIIGTDKSVPTLAKMLTTEDGSDMARYALERIPGQAVDSALLAALPKATGKAKIGIVNSLGQRRCAKAVAALGELAGSSDEAVAEAAVAALGQIANADAAKILAGVKGKAGGKVLAVALDAYLRCADKMVGEGKKTEATAIYKELQAESMPKPIKTAALRGMLEGMKGRR